MRFVTLSIGLAILFAVPLTAQTPVPDTLDAEGYFPLDPGNEWHFDRRTLGIFNNPERWTEGWRVIGDSLVGSHRYAVLQMCRRNFDSETVRCAPDPILLRYAADVGAFVSLQEVPSGEDDAEVPWGELPCPIRDTPASEAFCESSGYQVYSYSEAAYYEQLYTFGFTFSDVYAKTFQSLISYDVLVYGVGPAEHQFGDPDVSYRSTLIYASTAVAELGTPAFAFPNSAAPRPAAATLALALTPNPSAGPVVAAITGAAPGPLRLDAFDLLGRRVASASLTTSGAATVPLDLRGAAPGLYVVRVANGERTLTRRLTITR